MSHIDTLKVYNEYLAMGKTPQEASAYTHILEDSFMTKVNELKEDFMSNGKQLFVNTLILLALGGIGSQLWGVSRELGKFEYKLESIVNKLTIVENRLTNLEYKVK